MCWSTQIKRTSLLIEINKMIIKFWFISPNTYQLTTHFIHSEHNSTVYSVYLYLEQVLWQLFIFPQYVIDTSCQIVQHKSCYTILDEIYWVSIYEAILLFFKWRCDKGKNVTLTRISRKFSFYELFFYYGNIKEKWRDLLLSLKSAMSGREVERGRQLIIWGGGHGPNLKKKLFRAFLR